MGKSLGDYNIEQSSSQDIKNIKWTQKNSVDTKKPKKKRITKNNPSSYVIYTKTSQKISGKREFKIENTVKPKKKRITKKHQSSDASTCKIEPGFKRPGR